MACADKQCAYAVKCLAYAEDYFGCAEKYLGYAEVFINLVQKKYAYAIKCSGDLYCTFILIE